MASALPPLYFNIEPRLGSVAFGFGLYPKSKRWISCFILLVFKSFGKPTTYFY